ncbi:MAG: hypothetical protein GF419_11080 [Ignavibacteriales bacterium]|nr:hypothetical protein [Ignavibacteriales bacterium]
MKKKLPNGVLWGALLVLGYSVAFLAIGVYLVWNVSKPVGEADWLALIGSSILYLAAGVVGFVVALALGGWMALRDSAPYETIKRMWPLLLLVVYYFVPNLPGPIDEAIATAVAAIVQGYLVKREEGRRDARDREAGLDPSKRIDPE